MLHIDIGNHAVLGTYFENFIFCRHFKQFCRNTSANRKNSPKHIAAGMKFVIFAKDKNSLIYDNGTYRGQYA